MTPASSIRMGRDADNTSLMRKLDEEELSQFGGGAGRPVWNKAKTVSDMKWSGRTTMPLSEWNIYRPEVACGLIQELRGHKRPLTSGPTGLPANGAEQAS